MSPSQKQIRFGKPCLALALVLILGSVAQATSPAVGAEMASAITQKMLSAPALPSLDGGRPSLGLSYGTTSLEMIDRISTPTSVLTADGNGKGQQFGLSLTIPTKSDFGFFFFVLGNKSSGEVHVFQDGAATYDMRDVKADAYAAIGGLSYRLLGSETSIFALGPFAGPAFVTMHTTSTFTPTGPSPTDAPTYFTIDPVSYGLFLGLQAVVRVGSFRINPYAVLLNDMSDSCKSVAATGPSLSYSCQGMDGKMDILTSFAGAGLYLGYRWIQFNVFSETLTPGRFKITGLTGSIGIPL